MRRTIHAGSASDTWVPACAGSTRVLAACADVPDCDGSEPGQLWLRQRRLNGLLRPCWAPYFSWSPREVSKRRRPRLRRSARRADCPAVLKSAGGRRKLAALRQSTAESPARSCAHRRRNGDWELRWPELIKTAVKLGRLRCSRPTASRLKSPVRCLRTPSKYWRESAPGQQKPLRTLLVTSVTAAQRCLIRARDFSACWVRSARVCLLYTSPSPRDQRGSRMPSSA